MYGYRNVLEWALLILYDRFLGISVLGTGSVRVEANGVLFV